MNCQLKRFCLLLCGYITFFFPPLLAKGEPEKTLDSEHSDATIWIENITIKGSERSDVEWIKDYLNIKLPVAMSRSDALAISRKLMTTGVFSEVKVAFQRNPKSESPKIPESFSLEVLISEKWTTIPVVRGVYGGGTPLRVIGLYDTHVGGKLFTLGGELRKYGEAPPGFVLFFRDPRAKRGHEYYGVELWNDRRIRDIYNKEKQITGTLLTHSHKFKARYLAQPFQDSQWVSDNSSVDKKISNLMTGVELEIIKQFPGQFTPSPKTKSSPNEVNAESFEETTYVELQPSIVYDSIESSLLELDGLRFKLQVGPTLFRSTLGSSQELDAYYYALWPLDLNMGFHFYFWNSSTTTNATQYYLGGFDSVRGFPDGLQSGSTALFSNFELRHILLKSKYLWIQGVSFLDGGAAGQSWEKTVESQALASVGMGFRFAIPQIYRLMFRIDYAFSLIDNSKGITAGMNQFFDPFNPL